MILAKDIQGRERVQDISKYLEKGRHAINFSIKKIDEERKDPLLIIPWHLWVLMIRHI